MKNLITAADLHEAADDELMMRGGSPKGAMEGLGIEENSVRDFLRESSFHWPQPEGGIPDNLDKWSTAYGICLGIAVSKLRRDQVLEDAYLAIRYLVTLIDDTAEESVSKIALKKAEELAPGAWKNG